MLDNGSCAGYVYIPHVYCGGKSLITGKDSGEDEDLPNLVQIFYGTPGPSQINISIPASACSDGLSGTPATDFFVSLEHSNPWAADPHPALSAFVQSTAVIHADSVLSYGIVNGRSLIGLSGTFPSAVYSASVLCNGVTRNATVSQTNVNEIKIAFDTPPLYSSCRTWVQRTSDARLSTEIAFRPQGNAPNLPGQVGSYYWGGYQIPLNAPSSTLAGGATHSVQAGFPALRMVLTPKMMLPGFENVYLFGLNSSACPNSASGEGFLPCIVQQSPVINAFNSMPNGSTIVLTTADSTSTGAYQERFDFLDPLWWSITQNRINVEKEYSDLAYRIAQTQYGHNRTFVITNWEGDNMVYCSAEAYAHDESFAAECDSNFPPALEPSSIRLDGITRWFQARKDGIADGLERAQEEGLTGVTVVDGIEFASFSWLSEARYPDILHNVIPVVRPAYGSYSAWESAEFNGTLDEDLATIRGLLTEAGSNLMIGELGRLYMMRPGFENTIGWETIETLKAARRAGSSPTIIWESFDIQKNFEHSCPEDESDLGLFYASGAERTLTKQIRDQLIDYESTGVLPPAATQITRVSDRGLMPPINTFREYWLRGLFPQGGTYTATVRCNNVSTTATILSQSSTLIKLKIADPGLYKANYPCSSTTRGKHSWCTFSVKRNDLPVGSPTFGPRMVGYASSTPRRADILWRHSNGTVKIWHMKTSNNAGSIAEVIGYSQMTTVPGPDWQINGTGDFDGDSFSDILWRNTGSGEAKLWLTNGSSRASEETCTVNGVPLLPGPEWQIRGVGDFNGNGKSDILWRNLTTGEIKIWMMNGSAITSQSTTGFETSNNWQIAGTSNFDATPDVTSDIAWRNVSTGAVRVWFISNGSLSLSRTLSTAPPSAWQIQGTGDLDGNGIGDLLLRNSNGEVKVWFFDGTRNASAANNQVSATWQGAIVFPGTDWHIHGTGDYDADGKTDIVWRNDDGTVKLWLMNGAVIVSTPLSTVVPGPQDWQISGTGSFD